MISVISVISCERPAPVPLGRAGLHVKCLSFVVDVYMHLYCRRMPPMTALCNCRRKTRQGRTAGSVSPSLPPSLLSLPPSLPSSLPPPLSALSLSQVVAQRHCFNSFFLCHLPLLLCRVMTGLSVILPHNTQSVDTRQDSQKVTT